MSYCKSFTYRDSKICLLENTFSIEELLTKFEHPEYYRKRFYKINSIHRKKDFLAIRYALKLCFNGEEKEICYATDGKPSLKDSSYKISFSHSKDWVAVIVHPEFNVGIDVENPSERLIKVRKRFLHGKELEYYDANQSLNYLRVVWSAKEALYKIIGEDAYNFSQQLLIEPFEADDEGEIRAKHIAANKIYKVHYYLNERLTLAYCVEDEFYI